jgi:hypothetical protein
VDKNSLVETASTLIATVKQLLGQGIYTPSEAAFYARERTATVNRWLRGSDRGGRVVHSQFDDERFVSFLDFVQTLAIANLRRQYDVPLQTIREAVEESAKRFGIEYPFAVDHRIYLFDRSDGGKIETPEGETIRRYEMFIKRPNDSLVQLTGKHRGQPALKKVVQLYLSKVDFGPKGFAVQFRPFEWQGLEVTMNPRRRFGEPLTPSGYTAEALWDAVQSEGDIDKAANACGVDRKEVELACGYLDYLRFTPKRD